MIRKNVQVYIVSSNDRKLLMLKRTEIKSGYWQPVCGGIENGESAYEAAIREVNEETGITNYERIEHLPFQFEYQEPKDGVQMDMEDCCYLMIIKSQCEINLSIEHEKYEWIDMEYVSKLTDWMPIVSVCEYLTREYSAIDDQINN
jgi:8-oxo-dGTP pyrophosphatase MutT (NUDIX family)